jgi:predicted nucleic acid-binding protein
VIFLDANVLLRVLTAPATPQDIARQTQAISLLSRASADEVQVTFSEVVLHEVSYVLTSPRQYGFTPDQAIPMLRSILGIRGLLLPENDLAIFQLALDLWERYPKLEFSDAVIATRCEQRDCELASFDRHFDAVPSIRRWVPDES